MNYNQSKKEEFAKKEISLLVFQGALGRGYPIYKDGVNDKNKTSFRKYLSALLEKYSKKDFDRDFVNILNEFHSEVNSSEYVDILNGGCIPFGRVQKLLNLYLKYLWVFKYINNEPPHCPIDSIILGKVKWKGLSWTKPMFTKVEYMKAIGMCQEKAKGMSLAEWELHIFNKRSNPIV